MAETVMKRTASFAERFQEDHMPVTESGCWIWLKHCEYNGYGRTTSKGVPISAHRASWQLHRGDIPAGMHVLHRCDTRCCVNPDHLFLGTHQDNMADRQRKGRNASGDVIGKHFAGEKNWSAKLTEEKVRQIRARRMAGDTQVSLAEEYGVSRWALRQIISGQTWRHLLQTSVGQEN